VARLLLAYGADINSTDKSGKKPRDVSTALFDEGCGVTHACPQSIVTQLPFQQCFLTTSLLLQFQPTMDIANLVKQHDAHGALAFEDTPGTWIRASTDSGGERQRSGP
jgi:hypothetical protein